SRYGPFSSVPYGWSQSQLACVPLSWSPKWNGFDNSPPRQECSHSASLGKRYERPHATSSGSDDNFSQNANASSHDTVSTGNDHVSIFFTCALPLPFFAKRLGFVPITA